MRHFFLLILLTSLFFLIFISITNSKVLAADDQECAGKSAGDWCDGWDRNDNYCCDTSETGVCNTHIDVYCSYNSFMGGLQCLESASFSPSESYHDACSLGAGACLCPSSTPTPTPTSTPTPTPTSTPSCPIQTCTYSQADATCASKITICTGSGVTGHNVAGCTYTGGCSGCSCYIPGASPTPTSTPTPTPTSAPTPTPPPGSCENNCGGLGVCGFRKSDNTCTTDNSCCHRTCSGNLCTTVNGSGVNTCNTNADCGGGGGNTAVYINPNPAVSGSTNVTYTATGTVSCSPWYGIQPGTGLVLCGATTGISCSGNPMPDAGSRPCWWRQTCTAGNPGTYTARFTSGSPINPNCTSSANYTVTTSITPWIQVWGDVHSNTKISAPGGP